MLGEHFGEVSKTLLPTPIHGVFVSGIVSLESWMSSQSTIEFFLPTKCLPTTKFVFLSSHPKRFLNGRTYFDEFDSVEDQTFELQAGQSSDVICFASVGTSFSFSAGQVEPEVATRKAKKSAKKSKKSKKSKKAKKAKKCKKVKALKSSKKSKKSYDYIDCEFFGSIEVSGVDSAFGFGVTPPAEGGSPPGDVADMADVDGEPNGFHIDDSFESDSDDSEDDELDAEAAEILQNAEELKVKESNEPKNSSNSIAWIGILAGVGLVGLALVVVVIVMKTRRTNERKPLL